MFVDVIVPIYGCLLMVKCVENSNSNVTHSGPKMSNYNVGHYHWYDIHTTLPERCLNIGPQFKLVTLAAATTFIHCCLKFVSIMASNVWKVMLLQCWLNIVSMFSHDIGERYCHNIYTTLPECCLNVRPQCWGKTLPQCGLDVVSMLIFNAGKWYCYIFHKTWPEHCLHNVREYHCYDVAWILSKWQSPMLKSNITTPFTQCWYNIIVTMLANIVTTWWQCWDCGWNTTLIECSHSVVWTSTQGCWDI